MRSLSILHTEPERYVELQRSSWFLVRWRREGSGQSDGAPRAFGEQLIVGAQDADALHAALSIDLESQQDRPFDSGIASRRGIGLGSLDAPANVFEVDRPACGAP